MVSMTHSYTMHMNIYIVIISNYPTSCKIHNIYETWAEEG